MSQIVELRGHAAKDGQVVMVGKAEQVKDHGTPCWLCSTLPPNRPFYEVVTYRQNAIQWLKDVAGAEEVFEGAVCD